MDKRIELNHTHNNGEGGWKDADGVIYTINNDGATACAYGSDKDISNPNIVIANEVAIDGNVYPAYVGDVSYELDMNGTFVAHS